jgi:hypothetical protein
LFAQCGGQGYTGGTKCRTGSCCFLGDYFSQCLEQCPEVAQQYRQIQSDDNQDGYIHLTFCFKFRRILFLFLKNNKKKGSSKTTKKRDDSDDTLMRKEKVYSANQKGLHFIQTFRQNPFY